MILNADSLEKREREKKRRREGEQIARRRKKKKKWGDKCCKVHREARLLRSVWAGSKWHLKRGSPWLWCIYPAARLRD